jgi:hypothetical protein
VVYDIKNGKNVGVIRGASHPHFGQEPDALVVSDGDYPHSHYRFFQISNDQLMEMKRATSEPEATVHLALGSYGLVTARPKPSLHLSYPDWFPPNLRDLVNEWTGRNQQWWKISFQDYSTGAEQSALSILVAPEPTRGGPITGIYKSFAPRLECSTFVARDARSMLVQDKETISLWEVPFHVPLSCWLICSGLLLAGLLFIWPHKIKVT